MLAPILMAWLRARPPSYSAVAGGGLGRAGLTISRMLSSQPGLVGRTLTSAADTAGLGGIAGFTVVYTAVADKRIRNIWGK